MRTTLTTASFSNGPFAHTVCSQILPHSVANAALHWFETDAPWNLRVENFYEQYELNLHQHHLPKDLLSLINGEVIEALSDRLLSPLTRDRLTLVEVNAHKLVCGQTIKIHNDYVGCEETHRIIVQINRNWSDEGGGVLMLFSGPSVNDVARLIRPIHGSGIGFEISPMSYHAVSTIHAGERFTLVYSFRRAG